MTWDNSKCCCRHPDARACLVARHPEQRERVFNECECNCHDDERQRETDDWNDMILRDAEPRS